MVGRFPPLLSGCFEVKVFVKVPPQTSKCIDGGGGVVGWWGGGGVGGGGGGGGGGVRGVGGREGGSTVI